MNIHSIPSGTVIRVPRGPIEHFGILAEPNANGCRTVISGSLLHGRVVEEPFNEFAKGETISIEGYPGTLPDWLVLQRARSVLDSEYLLLTWNCEHVVRFAHGLRPSSPQIQSCIAIGFGVLIFLTATRQ